MKSVNKIMDQASEAKYVKIAGTLNYNLKTNAFIDIKDWRAIKTQIEMYLPNLSVGLEVALRIELDVRVIRAFLDHESISIWTVLNLTWAYFTENSGRVHKVLEHDT